MIQEAIEKLRREREEAKGLGRAAQVMAKPVAEQLESFCEQSEDFSRAVLAGGAFADCMRAVERGCGSSLSDLEAYRRAVRFYFRGAEVRMALTIDLGGGDNEAGKKEPGMVLNLADYL